MANEVLAEERLRSAYEDQDAFEELLNMINGYVRCMPGQDPLLDLHIFAIKCAMTNQPCLATFEKLWQHINTKSRISNDRMSQIWKLQKEIYDNEDTFRLE